MCYVATMKDAVVRARVATDLKADGTEGRAATFA
jgi:hypothetical protein